MSQTEVKNATIDHLTYVPPALPDYLSKAYKLKVIVGVPTHEETKAIHDAIRALNGLANSIPSLYDPELSTQLAQHLFTVQMAIYRNEYPASIFPSENVYTPPPLPPHIPISLEPVVGAPSDKDLESAHKVVRAMEQLATNPLFEFDPALNVTLSQHLFNIQFARYIQDSNQGTFAPTRVTPLSPPTSSEIELPNPPTLDIEELTEPQDEIASIPNLAAPQVSQAPPANRVELEPIDTLHSNVNLGQLCAAQQETNRLLGGNKELLKDIRRTLVSFQSLRFRSTHSAYSTTNKDGELPWMHNLPPISFLSTGYVGDAGYTIKEDISKQQLVAYLRFYNLDTGLVEVDGFDSLKPGKEPEAKQRLGKYLYRGYSP